MNDKVSYYAGGGVLIISAIMKYFFSFSNSPIYNNIPSLILLALAILLGVFAFSKSTNRFAYFLFLGRIFVGGFFIFAALSKIVEPDKFAKEIANYKIMPDWTINSMALAMPWIELFSGIGLLFGAKMKANSAIIGAMLFVFIVAISTAYARGLNINCGCSAQLGSELVGWGKIFEDLAMLIIAYWTFIDKKPIYAMDTAKSYQAIENI